MRPSPIRLGAATIAVLLISLLAADIVYVAGPGERASRHGASVPPGPPLRTYRDPDGRFTIGLPSTWRETTRPGPVIALGAAGPSGGSLLVRVLPLGASVSSERVAQLEPLTDELVGLDRIRLLERRRVAIGGAGGYYYRYSLTVASHRTAINAHYFLFRGRALLILVLRAVPAGEFHRLAPLFARVAASLTVA